VTHSKKEIFISQHKCVTDLLQETEKTTYKSASTPIDPNKKEDIVVDKEMYQRLVSKLIYISHTRLDVTFVVSLVNQFMHKPKEINLQDAPRIVQYLKEISDRGILFERYCTFLGGNLVTQKSKKQSEVSRPSDKVDFRAMSQ